jgi:hypothetical protein
VSVCPQIAKSSMHKCNCSAETSRKMPSQQRSKKPRSHADASRCSRSSASCSSSPTHRLLLLHHQQNKSAHTSFPHQNLTPTPSAPPPHITAQMTPILQRPQSLQRHQSDTCCRIPYAGDPQQPLPLRVPHSHRAPLCQPWKWTAPRRELRLLLLLCQALWGAAAAATAAASEGTSIFQSLRILLVL